MIKSVVRSLTALPVLGAVVEPLLTRLRMVKRQRQRPHFTKAYRAHLERRRLPRTHPKRRVYFQYAMTAVERANDVVALMQRERELAGIRYLDVGAAYGAFPIAFARAGAEEAVGLEMDPQLIELAHELRRDLPCPARMVRGDAMDASAMAALGEFDVITCNDVIEHVDDPWLLTRHLAAAMRPGGLLYLSIPNSRALTNVLSDPHYGLFGICLLPRPEAKWYYDHLTFSEAYDVGEYYTLPDYVGALERLGLQARVLNADLPAAAQVDKLAGAVDDLRRTAARRLAKMNTDATTQQRVELAVTRYVRDFETAYRSSQESGQPPATTREILLTYETAMWQVLSRRP